MNIREALVVIGLSYFATYLSSAIVAILYGLDPFLTVLVGIVIWTLILVSSTVTIVIYKSQESW